MGIAYRCDERIGVSVSVWDGQVAAQDAYAHMAETMADPRWGSGGKILTDLSTVARTSAPSDDNIRELAAGFEASERFWSARWAFVASNIFQEAIKFTDEIGDDVDGIVVFNSIEVAAVWLGVDGASLRAVVNELRAEIRSR